MLRISGSSVAPTSLIGTNPPAFEDIVSAYTSLTSLTTATVPPVALSGVNYTISDAIDIEPGAMTTAFLRCCEWQAAIARRLETRQEAFELYKEALVTAKEADARSTMNRAEGMPTRYRIPINRMPMGPDQGS